MKKSYRIKGIDCANCAAKMERQIGKIDGVGSCSVNFILQKLTIEAEEDAMADIMQKAAAIVRKIDRGAEIVIG